MQYMMLIEVIDILAGYDIDFTIPVAIKRVKLSELLSLTIS